MPRLWIYASTPGAAASPEPEWPRASALTRESGRPTLVMFAHPQCPCSRATLGELAVLLGHAPHRATVDIVFFRPAEAAPGWERTELWRSAEALPAVTVSVDPDGVEATRFDALVSGQTYLYDAAGRLLFSGGITAARGHSGDNAGRAALERLLTVGGPASARTHVFGCALRHSTRL